MALCIGYQSLRKLWKSRRLSEQCQTSSFSSQQKHKCTWIDDDVASCVWESRGDLYNHYHMCNPTCVNINQYLWPKNWAFIDLCVQSVIGFGLWNCSYVVHMYNIFCCCNGLILLCFVLFLFSFCSWLPVFIFEITIRLYCYIITIFLF